MDRTTLQSNGQWLLYFSLSNALVTDSIISTTLCILLARRRTAFTRFVLVQSLHWQAPYWEPSVNNTVRTLILYTVNTGALTTLCALVCLIAVRYLIVCGGFN